MRARHPFFLLLSTCVVGGMFGAIANSVALWAAGRYGLTEAMGVALSPELTWAWLKPRILWGGIWGAGFSPIAGAGFHRVVFWGLVYSLIPSAVQIFHVFPHLQGGGPMGMALGRLTPALVVGVNAVYGLVMALWVRVSVARK